MFIAVCILLYVTFGLIVDMATNPRYTWFSLAVILLWPIPIIGYVWHVMRGGRE